MANFSDIPKPSFPSSKQDIKAKTTKELQAMIDERMKIAREGQKIRNEYTTKSYGSGTNCGL